MTAELADGSHLEILLQAELVDADPDRTKAWGIPLLPPLFSKHASLASSADAVKGGLTTSKSDAATATAAAASAAKQSAPDSAKSPAATAAAAAADKAASPGSAASASDEHAHRGGEGRDLQMSEMPSATKASSFTQLQQQGKVDEELPLLHEQQQASLSPAAGVLGQGSAVVPVAAVPMHHSACFGGGAASGCSRNVAQLQLVIHDFEVWRTFTPVTSEREETDEILVTLI